MNATRCILLYLALCPFSFLLFAIAWLVVAPNYLYHCWDDAPPFVISWFPPFIHPWANSADGNLRDYYLAPEWVVYLVWLTFIAGIFVLPALVTWRRLRNDQQAPGAPDANYSTQA
ncbi:MAG TPA: hypothetical protein VG167_01200 [Verrucomicrobiae bacterium]|nr:hypothetical protein [Verrucomicrobiae bacterium]